MEVRTHTHTNTHTHKHKHTHTHTHTHKHTHTHTNTHTHTHCTRTHTHTHTHSHTNTNTLESPKTLKMAGKERKKRSRILIKVSKPMLVTPLCAPSVVAVYSTALHVNPPKTMKLTLLSYCYKGEKEMGGKKQTPPPTPFLPRIEPEMTG